MLDVVQTLAFCCNVTV